MFSVKSLPVATRLLDNESINSWLLRASLNQGCNLSTILFYHWSKHNLRHHDFDKGFNHIDKQIHQDMAMLAKTNVSSFDNRSLIKLNSDIGLEYQPNSSLTWILPIPKFHSKTMVGHQYCYQCMHEDKNAYLKIKWRFSWFVYCKQHLISLQNTCASCGLPYQPHLIKADHQFINKCPHCREKLCAHIEKGPICLDTYQFQTMAEQALFTNQATALERQITSADWFELMLFFINLIRKSTLEKNLIYYNLIKTFGISVDNLKLSKTRTGLKFDYLSYDERVMLMAYANQMHKITFDNWLSACEKNNLTQNSFRLGKRPVIPKAFLPVYEELPSVTRSQLEGQRTILKPKSSKAVNTSWERMQLRIEKLRIYDQTKPNKRTRRVTKL
ncbi:hypothetical protein BTW00_09740 [Psychrobacter sp. C 20.9]|uniref:TniQ family protein n=1 Tax=Psychrobacter sp. C 20.9 TaxID=1926477 RepID=UPI000946D64A|nr:TniQ family protein [Psychrobacter sp. C 20.9]OLF35211.1 hypothetical protein BTW00_09740 [Psychrobacter sp. C 20.9]